MARTIGIDLGTTNSCVATLDAGQPSVLPNAEGARTTPSVVAWDDDGEMLVGVAARRQAVTNPKRTVYSIKRFMGRRVDEVAEEQEMVPYEITQGPNGAVRVRIDDRELSPEQISAMVLQKLKADAEEFLGEGVSDAVITVPAYFNDAQRQATKDAGKIAGLNVLRLVNEPTAAALAYGYNASDERKLLVFDLGGGTFDVSVLEIGDGVFEVLATSGDNHLGGDDFDKVIVDWLVGEFKKAEGIDLAADANALSRLHEAAEKAKIELSSTQKTRISLPFISAGPDGPKHLDIGLTRAELTKLVAPLLDRLNGPIEAALHAADLPAEEIDNVLLVGGMTRMPAVAERVAELVGKDPQRGVNPDEAVALGAAVQAGVLDGQVSDVLLLDVTPLALGIETKGGITDKLIPANTTIPTTAVKVFTTAEDNQSSVEVHVVQGEREMARDNRTLGRIQLMGIPPAPAGTPQIEVTFALSADGILDVQARDLGSGLQKELRVEATTGLSSEEIERMRKEAEQYAELDRIQRRIAELRNDTEALRDQAEKTLRAHAEHADEQQCAALAKAIEATDEMLAAQQLDEVELRRTAEQLALAVQQFAETLQIQPEPAETMTPAAPAAGSGAADEGEDAGDDTGAHAGKAGASDGEGDRDGQAVGGEDDETFTLAVGAPDEDDSEFELDRVEFDDEPTAGSEAGAN
jgi:molecular chaperone DnaK